MRAISTRLFLALTLTCLLISPAFADIIIYDNGPTSGLNSAYYIDGPDPGGPFGQSIANQFTATNTGSVSGLNVGLWVPAGTTPTTVQWWLGNAWLDNSLGGGVLNITAADRTFLLTNSGFDVYNVHFTGLSSATLFAGNSYWLTLGNGNNSSGDRVVAWDINGGPAASFFGVGNTFIGGTGGGSEAFTINAEVPEPFSLAIWSGLGLVGLIAARRKKLTPVA